VAQGIGVHVSIVDQNLDFKKYDAVLVTDVTSPQDTYDAITEKVDCQKILTLKLLHISRVIP